MTWRARTWLKLVMWHIKAYRPICSLERWYDKFYYRSTQLRARRHTGARTCTDMHRHAQVDANLAVMRDPLSALLPFVLAPCWDLTASTQGGMQREEPKTGQCAESSQVLDLDLILVLQIQSALDHMCLRKGSSIHSQ